LSTEKKLPPVAVCTKCGAVTHSAHLINETHHCDVKRRGTWGSRLNSVGDWRECEQCKATGISAGLRCNRCRGEGWHDIRPRF
jgi:hypothetical protein